MISTVDQSIGFSSERGWNVCLPLGWKVLPKAAGEVSFGLDNVEVFAHPADPALSICWICSPKQISQRLWQHFCQATMMIGSINPAQAQEIMSQAFPLMGKVVTAFSVVLGDGQRAIELTEEIVPFASSSIEAMRGYHLLMPVKSKETSPLHMQQLVFYARQSKFSEEIVDVIKSARSFRQ